MEENIEFDKIGKKSPDDVPEGFFENISLRTLQKIKEREKRHTRIMLFSKLTAVAASIAIIISLAFLFSRPAANSTDKQIVQQQSSTTIQKEQKTTDSAVPKKRNLPKVASINQDEDLDDVLVDLSEDELLQLAALYSTDPFSNDSVK